MTTSSGRLPDALARYKQAVDALRDDEGKQSALPLLQALLSRDQVQTALTDDRRDQPTDILLVVSLDESLKEQAKTLLAVANLAEWRNSLNPPPAHWWWYLDSQQPRPAWKRFKWLWSALALVAFIIALSISADIAKRFLVEGPDATSAFAVLGQGLLSLLVAGSLVTKTGQELLDRAMKGLPAFIREEASLILALLLLLIVVVIHQLLPDISICYNNRGRLHHQAGELLSAQYDYRRAIHLQPDYATAHYNLGLLYEDLLDYKTALTEYQIALKGGLDAAYNNAARLYILQDEPAQAVSLLITGLRLSQDPVVLHDMYKNLGWARIKQGAFADAQVVLEQAIDLEDMSAPDHCLLAQALEGLDLREEASVAWRRCVALANSAIPEEDAWRIQGQIWLEATRE